MPYIMRMYVDGGCRGNGQPGAIGAAACVSEEKWGGQQVWTRILPDWPTPTNQRAELIAVIIALQQGLERYAGLRSYPYMNVTIHTDSKYVLGCMTEWEGKWVGNGFLTSSGHEVVNQDLIEEAYDLEERLRKVGRVDFVWVPRENNQVADAEVNEVLDQM